MSSHHHLSLLSDCSRILPSCPLRAHPTAPTRSAAIIHTCCQPPLATWAAQRPATVARRTSAEEREHPHRTSLSAATASSNLETMADSFQGRTLYPNVMSDCQTYCTRHLNCRRLWTRWRCSQWEKGEDEATRCGCEWTFSGKTTCTYKSTMAHDL